MEADDTDALPRKHADAPAASPARVLREGTRVGHYEVLARLGAGGMGVVYRARDTRLGREVALKFLTETRLDDRSRIRFRREAHLLSAVSHPNVVALHDVGDHDGVPYLVTELLQGQTLRELISAGPLPWQRAIALVEQVAEGLAGAYVKHIVHRDLKPENVFVTDAGHVKILDFGVARLGRPGPPEDESATDVLTRSGTTVGTPAYMSPEQLRFEHVDGRSDLFSLGCVLYELLVGKRPFNASTGVDLSYAVCHHEPAPLPPPVPPQVAAVVLRCLQKDPRDRFQTARELAAALHALQISGEQVAAASSTATLNPVGDSASPASEPLRAVTPPTPEPDPPPSFFQELARRRVFRTVVAYGVAAFAILQVVEPIMHGLHWPDAVLSAVVVALALGFPLVVGVAWAFDIRAGKLERAAPAPAPRPARLVPLLVGVGVLVAAPGVIYFFLSRRVPPRTDAERSVAVLPFANLSPDKDNEFFAEGVHSELITQLGKIAGLKVIARGSVQSYRDGTRDFKAIGEALGVSTLLEGSVQRAGGRVRIAAQLVDAVTSRQLWSERYDRDLADTFAIQTDVALDIARTLGTKLTPRETQTVERVATADPEAYDYYMRGRYLLYRSDIWKSDNDSQAVVLLERAIGRDPAFALAHAALASAKAWMGHCDDAKQHADKALSLQSDLPEGHAARGLVIVCGGTYAYTSAVKELEIALQGAPNDAEIRSDLGEQQMLAGQVTEGLENLRLAFELDPRSPRVAFHYGADLLAFSRQFAIAERVLVRVLEMSPEDYFAAYTNRIVPLYRDGDLGPGRELLEAWLNSTHHDLNDEVNYMEPNLMATVFPEQVLKFAAAARLKLPAWYRLEALAIAHSTLGHRTEAMVLFGDLQREVESNRVEIHKDMSWWRGDPAHGLLAIAYAGQGRANDASKELGELARSPVSQAKLLVYRIVVGVLGGQTAEALTALDQRLDLPGGWTAAFLRAAPFYAPLRSDPRFEQILAKHERMAK